MKRQQLATGAQARPLETSRKLETPSPGSREASRWHAMNVEVKSRVTDELLVQRRRGQIIAAAVELFSRQGYHRTTIQDVARKAGVSSGLIYQYVSDKEDVLLLALMSVLDSYRREIPAALAGLTDPLERWWATIHAYCRVVDERREATVLAYRSTKSLPSDRRQVIKQSEIETNALLADCLRACIAHGLFRSVNVEVVTYQFVSFAHTWALKHWRLKELCSLDEYVRSGFDLFAHGLFTAKGWRHYRKLLGSRQGTPLPSEESSTIAAEGAATAKDPITVADAAKPPHEGM
jgi:AcrR family transcriptional regulator